MFKITKLSETKSLATDKITGDPVAYIHKKPHIYSRGKANYVTEWHPAIKHLYPEVEKSFKFMTGIGRADAADSAYNRLEGLYSTLVNGKHVEPLQYEKTDSVTKPYNGHDVKFHVHKLYHEGNHVANLFTINLSDESNSANHVEYIGDQPTPEQSSIMHKKIVNNTPYDNMERVKYFQQLKKEKPSFVGSHTNSGQVSVYTTHLTPEEASQRFEDHLKTKLAGVYNTHEVVSARLSPTTFVVSHIHGYANKDTHFVDTTVPGQVHHIVGKTNRESYVSKAFGNVIQ